MSFIIKNFAQDSFLLYEVKKNCLPLSITLYENYSKLY